ncbi:MAG: hypothetical protein B7X10_00985, partial [Burkholderiales bacterium 21-58-4]
MAIDYDRLMAYQFPEIRHTLSKRDTAFYALSCGMGADPMNEKQLDFVDFHRTMKIMPSMPVILGYPGMFAADPATGINAVKVVHGEQNVTIHRPLPAEGEIIGRNRIVGLVDKGVDKGALLFTERTIHDAQGQLLATAGATVFLRGDGGFGGPAGPIPTPRALPTTKPDLVINSAAMCDSEACERDPHLAAEINFHAVAHIAGQCDTINAPLIQISTDYVFDGEKGEPYLTDDPMNPINVYGQTKMMGEEAARHGLHWHVIVRTSLVFSAFGQNVLTRTLRQIDTQDEIQAVTDQKANPTSAEAVAEALMVIGGAILRGKGDGFGTFHICGEPAVTRYEFLQAIMQAYAPFTERRPKLTPISSADIPNRVPRP